MSSPVRVGFKTAPRYTEWSTLDDIWASASGLRVFYSGWTFDHFYPADGMGPTFEGLTTLALLEHHVDAFSARGFDDGFEAVLA